MRCLSTTGVIFYWILNRLCYIHRAHHAWFDEYNSHVSYEENHTPGSLHLQHNSGIIFQHHYIQIDLITYELKLSDTPFTKSTIVNYELEIPPQGKKFGINLMDDDDFNIPYIVELVPNYLAGHKLPDQAKNNFFIVEIYGEYSIVYKGDLEEIKLHQPNKVK